jgi:hypothetical protein
MPETVAPESERAVPDPESRADGGTTGVLPVCREGGT